MRILLVCRCQTIEMYYGFQNKGGVVRWSLSDHTTLSRKHCDIGHSLPFLNTVRFSGGTFSKSLIDRRTNIQTHTFTGGEPQKTHYYGFWLRSLAFCLRCYICLVRSLTNETFFFYQLFKQDTKPCVFAKPFEYPTTKYL